MKAIVIPAIFSGLDVRDPWHPAQPIIQFKELEVDRVRYDRWKSMIRKQKKETKTMNPPNTPHSNPAPQPKTAPTFPAPLAGGMEGMDKDGQISWLIMQSRKVMNALEAPSDGTVTIGNLDTFAAGRMAELNRLRAAK